MGIGSLSLSLILGELQLCLLARSAAKALASEVAAQVQGCVLLHSHCLLWAQPHSPHPAFPQTQELLFHGCLLGGTDLFVCLQFFLLSSRSCVWERAQKATSEGYSHKMGIVGIVLGLVSH